MLYYLKKICHETDDNKPGNEAKNNFNDMLSTKCIIDAKSISPILQHKKLVEDDEEPVASDYDININDDKSLSSINSNNNNRS